uniref:Uncharacterized protein n=1 Tax=Globisporangium ultimum (strain ATCC 200006 / CBS 805.95 / DAOM BR144) TaxID=431595 RepID=K3X0W3_GLOUD
MTGTQRLPYDEHRRLKLCVVPRRIHRVLNELRADPSLWATFERNVKQYQHEQRSKHKAFDKIRENKQRVQSPRLATALEEKKKQAEDRMARNKRQREQLVRVTEARLEARRLTYQLRVAACAKHHSSSISPASAVVDNPPHSAEERARALGVRRHKVWLVTVAFAVVTAAWAAKFASNKHLVRIAAQHARAAQTIQRRWRAWKWCHASTPSVVLCTRLRRCLWKLLFNVRCRRKVRLATLLQRFMVDQCSGSRETRNFNRMMVKWRSNVIRSQRSSRDFVMCTRARLHALAMWWDRIDHERQRQERHAHERRLVEQPSAQRVGSLPGAAITTTSAARPSTRNSNSGTLLQLESMNEKLTSLQQVLTPIEIQRLQQHAFHVVRIAKSVKMQLLHEYLALARKEFTRRLTQYTEQRHCASYTRKVRLDDARAIVQNSLSWGSLMLDRYVGPATSSSNDTSSSVVCVRRPVLALFAGTAARQRMEELVRRSVQLTLERDAEQRAVVERQRQVLDASAALGSLPKKRESNGGGKDAASNALLLKKRQSTRRLGLLLPFFRDTGTPSNSAAAPGSSIAVSASAAMASESVHEATDEADE